MPAASIPARSRTSTRQVGVRGGELLGARGQAGGRELVGGGVLQVAGGVGGLGSDAAALDRAAHVVVGGEQQLGEPRSPSSSSAADLYARYS